MPESFEAIFLKSFLTLFLNFIRRPQQVTLAIKYLPMSHTGDDAISQVAISEFVFLLL